MTEHEKIRKAKNEYMREWRKNNKDKVTTINKKYWLNKYEQEVKADAENWTNN